MNRLSLFCIVLLGLVAICQSAPLVEYGVTMPSLIIEDTPSTSVHVPLEDFTTAAEIIEETTKHIPSLYAFPTIAEKPASEVTVNVPLEPFTTAAEDIEKSPIVEKDAKPFDATFTTLAEGPISEATTLSHVNVPLEDFTTAAEIIEMTPETITKHIPMEDFTTGADEFATSAKVPTVVEPVYAVTLPKLIMDDTTTTTAAPIESTTINVPLEDFTTAAEEIITVPTTTMNVPLEDFTTAAEEIVTVPTTTMNVTFEPFTTTEAPIEFHVVDESTTRRVPLENFHTEAEIVTESPVVSELPITLPSFTTTAPATTESTTPIVTEAPATTGSTAEPTTTYTAPATHFEASNLPVVPEAAAPVYGYKY